MSLPQGIDFRATSAFVTDPANCTFEIGASANYPRTTPQGNTVGWETAPSGTRDRTASVDARLAGVHFNSAATTSSYRIDLPAPGDYTITFGIGDATIAERIFLELFDDTTSLGVIASNTGGTIPAGEFYDASGVLRTSPADWVANNATITKAFSSTICRFKIGGIGTPCPIAHIFIASSGGGGTTITLGQVIWGVSGRAPVMKVQLALAQKAANWSAHGAALQSRLVLGAAAWAWAGRSPKLAAFIALGRAALTWSGRGPALSSFLVLGQKAAAWVGNGAIFSGSTVISLARASWNWAANGITPLSSGAVYSAVVPAIRTAVRAAVRSALSRS